MSTKVKPAGKIAIVLVVIGAIIGVYYGGGFHKSDATTNKTDATTLAAAANENASSNEEKTSSATSELKTVNVKLSPPIAGVKKGVVEVGASGFNCFVVSIDKQKNWELIYKEFGKSLAYEGFATVQDVQTGLKTYIGTIFDKGVMGKDVHFVMSSGALKNEKTKLISKAIRDMGYVVNEVTAEKEGQYALLALQPKDYRNNSFVVDIGSGNTKISWYDGSVLKSLEGPGAKYYMKDGANDQDAYQQIADLISQVPTALRENCFIIGGVPYSLAAQTRNGEERYTALQNPEFYSAGDDVKVKSGLNIYRAITETSKCQNVIFDFDANFTIGFLSTLN